MNHDHGLVIDTRVIPVESGDAVDCANAEGVQFICVFNAADAGNKLELQTGKLADGSDQAAVKDRLDASVVAELQMDAVATVGRIECHKPEKRFVSCEVTGAGTMVAVLYGSRSQPTTPSAECNEASFVSPE